jgi:N utilization substance protein B
MPSRHKARERALQVLYQWDMRKHGVEECIAAVYGTLNSEEGAAGLPPDDFLEALVHGTVDRVADIDGQIARHADNWRIERMPIVDRNILRLAVFEMTHTDTPAPVVIDEALELARKFAGEESVHFVNGVLDAVHKERKGAGAADST